MVDCSTDLTGDKTNDCLISGKGGVLKLLNGHDGSSVWHFVELDADSGIHGEPFVNVFSAQFVQDVDGDGLPDVLAAHTQDTPPGLSDNVLTGHLILISGKNGVFLQKVSTPRGEETYYAPQVLVHLDGESIVVFGTGGQASPGGLYAIPLHHLVKGNTLQIQELHRDEMKGIMSPPVLADLNQDGFEDIVAAMFDTMVVAFNGLTLQPLWNYTFPESETFSAPTPGYFNDDNIPDILVKYQKGPGFPVYYSSQTTVLDGKSGVPLLDKPIVDTTGSQMGGLSISVEGLGNDFLLYWTANCLNHEGPTKPYMYMPGSTVQAQSRTDLCQNLFNSTLYTQFIALSQHIEPPGIAVYSSEDRKSLEYNNSVNTSAQAHKYLGSHPDVLDMYDQGMMYNKVAPNEKKEFGDIPGTSSFRHRGDNSIAGNSDQGKDSNYFFNGDYLASKHRQNQISNDAGEQEEMLNSDFQGNSEFPNVRKHGGTHPLERTWQQEQQQADDSNVPLNYNNLIDNPVPNRDTDYDLYGPAVSAESLSSNNQGYVMDNQQNKGMMPRRIKREETPILHGLQRLTSLGTLIPSHWPSRKNDSVDLVFVTYWINPLTEAQVIVGKDKDCIERKQADLDVANGIDPEVIARDCLGYKWKKKGYRFRV